MRQFMSKDRAARLLGVLICLVAFMFFALGLLLLSDVIHRWLPGQVSQLLLGAFLLGLGAMIAVGYNVYLYRGQRRGGG